MQYPANEERLVQTADVMPARLRNLMQRLARLERGKVYTLVLIVPDSADGEPCWSLQNEAKLENAR